MTALNVLTVVVCSILHLSLAAEVNYPPCPGVFSDDPPFDSRPLPEDYTDQGLVYVLHTRSTPLAGVEFTIQAGGIEVPDEFDPSKDTKVLIHGWNSNRGTLADIKDSYLDAADVNVIIVDWETGANRVNYALSASNTRVIGDCTAYMAEQLGGSNYHCTGHSLGGQTCGYMGKSGPLARITAMDPAGPLFENFDDTVRVDRSDADYVDVIHTQCPPDGDIDSSLGMRLAVGDADFYPNNGARQDGCTAQLCDHNRAFEYMRYSIDNPNCYNACPCDVSGDVTNCYSCSNPDHMGEPAEGESASGTYYLPITGSPPHCNSPP